MALSADRDGDPGDRLDAGEVRLVVPAAPEYLRLVRLTAAGLASRMGFTFDEVEDLRIAVDEVCFLLIDDPSGDELFVERGLETPPGSQPERGTNGGPGTIELRYLAGPDSIGIEGSTRRSGALPEPNDLSMQILTALVDEVSITAESGTLAFRLMKTKETL